MRFPDSGRTRTVEEVGRSIMAPWTWRPCSSRGATRAWRSFCGTGTVRHIPISGTDEIADVTGAGDTVAAAVTLGLSSGADFYTAARIANCAAGIVVMKRGTAVVTAEELKTVIRGGVWAGGCVTSRL